MSHVMSKEPGAQHFPCYYGKPPSVWGIQNWHFP
eukprot:CAMPEP_0202339858 /NCGR_PEP_ID=MMETSP1126-20121109/1541_1 /ASSEMBLY_ACC=CAM_ASM_000457 /TAXON_ID=3047 /ORGANISM="Dunaliella tertiolecta, Strain CCMP1320" /LENGTH=33 /DNA_ID= /DNA_START= /DNA_END= /DNA_ORIENTATION=